MRLTLPIIIVSPSFNVKLNNQARFKGYLLSNTKSVKMDALMIETYSLLISGTNSSGRDLSISISRLNQNYPLKLSHSSSE